MDIIEQEGFNFNRFKFPKDKFLAAAIGLLLLGFILAAYGTGMFLHNGSGDSDDIKIIEASSSADLGQLVVDIDGAVIKPGVYNLNAGSRVNDAVIAAGGLAKEADSKRINLAAKVSDGQKVHIASVSDTVSSGTTEIVSANQSDLINVNSATEAQLDKLPGVGPVTAQKIIDARPYSDLSELVTKKAVGKSTFEKIKGMIGL